MISAKHISKSYGKKEILCNISFTINPGTLNAVVGENGVGKSTLMRILIGEISTDKGVVVLTGKVGYCPQYPLLFSMLTVEENFRYFASAYGLINYYWKARRDELMDQLGFKKYQHYLVEHLSGGTRQKLNLAIALLNDPDILILDEPYGAFDLETYQHFREMMFQLKDQGKGILLVTHLLNDVERFDQILTLKEGGLQ
ncbi:ABC transporter ATP-binding protein [Flavobacterium sp. ZS1P14]|uniref:ABC transporter ATP-binding protein n=1 Tax=Flavobacterium sp. ZS1P14 TaxID=3401729 RepID=UPI003AAA532B